MVNQMLVSILFYVTLSCAEANNVIKNVVKVPSNILNREQKIEIIDELRWSAPRECKFRGVENV